MTTTKKRINISLPKDVEDALRRLAKRDHVPQATKAVVLLEMALEIEEDRYFAQLADERMKANTKFIPHDVIWKKYTKSSTPKK